MKMDTTIKPHEYDYAAFAPCGCLVGLCYDMGNKDTAKSVSDWIKDGCHIERMSLAKVRETLDTKGFGCNCKEEKQQPSLFCDEAAR